MFKIRPTYSLLGVIVTLACQLPMFVAGLGGLVVEFITGLLILYKLQNTNQFDYDSIYGKILSQLTIHDNINLSTISSMIAVRLIAFALLAFELYWIAIPLYLLTIIHYTSNEEAGQ